MIWDILGTLLKKGSQLGISAWRFWIDRTGDYNNRGWVAAFVIIVGLVTGFIGFIVNPLLKAFTGWDLDQKYVEPKNKKKKQKEK